jgi:hypothetical protein
MNLIMTRTVFAFAGIENKTALKKTPLGAILVKAE